MQALFMTIRNEPVYATDIHITRHLPRHSAYCFHTYYNITRQIPHHIILVLLIVKQGWWRSHPENRATKPKSSYIFGTVNRGGERKSLLSATLATLLIFVANVVFCHKKRYPASRVSILERQRMSTLIIAHLL